jgi:hypothetical protein
MANETPEFKRVRALARDIELRDYSGFIVAQTKVRGNRSDAGNSAFRLLGGYIFGNNVRKSSIAMTAPVMQAQQGSNETIAMTAPVMQAEQGEGEWLVQFMMPRQYSIESLPEPTDPRVTLAQLPARRFAVIRYSGTWSQANYDEHLALLREAVAKAQLQILGEPLWARYNPPLTPWFLRTNEILIEVAP